tara:strand:- start:19577 stop:20419 length:843 start_codon:yes stop_codon:yes gene_type:complete
VKRKFDSLIRREIKESRLKRIRLRTDPAKIANHGDFAAIDGYEGYVLREKGDDYHLYIESLVDIPLIVAIPQTAMYPVEDDLEKVKYAGACHLDDANKLTPQLIGQLKTANCVDAVEAILRAEGATRDDLTEIYKKAVMEEGTIKNVAKGVAKGMGHVIDAPWKAQRAADFVKRASEKGPYAAAREARGYIKNKLGIKEPISKFDKDAITKGTAILSTDSKEMDIDQVGDSVIYFKDKEGNRFRSRYNEFKTIRGMGSNPDIIHYRLATVPHQINKGTEV